MPATTISMLQKKFAEGSWYNKCVERAIHWFCVFMEKHFILVLLFSFIVYHSCLVADVNITIGIILNSRASSDVTVPASYHDAAFSAACKTSKPVYYAWPGLVYVFSVNVTNALVGAGHIKITAIVVRVDNGSGNQLCNPSGAIKAASGYHGLRKGVQEILVTGCHLS